MLCTLACVYFLPAVGQVWSQLSDFPGVGRDDGASFTLNGVAYCGSGVASSFSTLADFYRFDMSTELWTSITGLPIGAERQYAVGFSQGDFGYIFGGVSGGIFLNDLWRYDPQSDTWLQLASMPDEGRSGSMCFVIGDNGYIVGGKTAETDALDDVWAFHIPTHTWVEKAPMPFGARWRAGAASQNGLGYLLGGMDEIPAFRSGFFEYAPETDTWTTLTSFPGEGRNYIALQSIGGVLTAFSGFDADHVYHNDMWQYIDGVWVELDGLPALGRRGGMYYTDGLSFYYTTGLFANTQRSVETWKAANILTSAEKKPKDRFEIFPNPTNAEVAVRLGTERTCGYTRITLFDRMGRLCYEYDFDPETEVAMNLANLEPGIYMIYLDNECGRNEKRLIKI